jgi:hypothetical protein
MRVELIVMKRTPMDGQKKEKDVREADLEKEQNV